MVVVVSNFTKRGHDAMCDCRATQTNQCVFCGTDQDLRLYPLLATSESGANVIGFTYNIFVCVECVTEHGLPRGALKHSNGKVYIQFSGMGACLLAPQVAVNISATFSN